MNYNRGLRIGSVRYSNISVQLKIRISEAPETNKKDQQENKSAFEHQENNDHGQ